MASAGVKLEPGTIKQEPVSENIESARSSFASILQENVSNRADDGFDDTDLKYEQPDWIGGFSVFGGFGGKPSPSRRIRPQPRRKKKRDDADSIEASTFHHTYVMRMFDRSVDLAQFTEDTPLYPVARAWLRNEPNVKPGGGLTSPSQDTPTGGAVVVKEEGNEEEDDKQSSSDVLELPLPDPYQEEGHPRIPEPLPIEVSDQLVINGEGGDVPSKEEIFCGHMTRWKQVRQTWKEKSEYNDERYAASLMLLKAMHSEALEKHEEQANGTDQSSQSVVQNN